MKTEKHCPRCNTTKPIEEFYDKPTYCRICARLIGLAWRSKNPKKRRAHVLIARALKYGELIKPNNCERCGNDCYLVGHHPNYSQPLVVQWVCDKCHGAIHAAERLKLIANKSIKNLITKKK